MLARLVNNGEPYIEGRIVHLIGVSGLAKGKCAVRFESSHVIVSVAHGSTVTLAYEDIRVLQIGGRGHIVESVNNAFIGGGFGLGGALKGAAEATLLNMVVSVCTRKERLECEILLSWATGELLMLNQEHVPEVVGAVLQPIVEKIGRR